MPWDNKNEDNLAGSILENILFLAKESVNVLVQNDSEQEVPKPLLIKFSMTGENQWSKDENIVFWRNRINQFAVSTLHLFLE